jgi:hypothetical protein
VPHRLVQLRDIATQLISLAEEAMTLDQHYLASLITTAAVEAHRGETSLASELGLPAPDFRKV